MKKNVLKKMSVFALAAIMATGMLAGCGEAEQVPSSESSVVTESPSVAESSEAAPVESVEVSESVAESSEAADTAMSPAKAIAAEFKAALADNQNLEEVTRSVIDTTESVPLGMDCYAVEEGFLNGFGAEINGFQDGVCFGPVIGSIPFIGYLFETDDAQTLVDTLNENAQLNWNICTIADEKYAEIIDDKYVVFVMSPKSFED